MTVNVARRELIKGFVVAYLGFAAPQVLAIGKQDNISELMAAMQSEDAILKLGDKFLQENPHYRNSALLEKELEYLVTLHGSQPGQTFKESVRRAIKEDFTRNQIISVDGWQFSKTETLLSALTVVTRG